MIDSKAVTFMPQDRTQKQIPYRSMRNLCQCYWEIYWSRDDWESRVISDSYYCYSRATIEAWFNITNHDDCKDCISDPWSCTKLKRCVQQLINQGTIRIGRPIKRRVKEVFLVDIPYRIPEVRIPVTPLVIKVLALFPYESTKSLPWRYEPKDYK